MYKNKFHFSTIFICLVVFYAQSAFAQDSALIEEGRKVFNEVAGLGCKTCHGEYAEGDLGVGPIIRGAKAGNIQAAVEAVGEMVAIRAAMGEEEVKAVSAYLSHLGTLQVVRTLSKRGRFVPKEQAVHPGTTVQIIVKNSGTKPQTYLSENMGIEPFIVQGRSTAAVIWESPKEEGTYTLACADCKLDDIFTVSLSNSAKPFIGTKPDTKLTDAE
jgi:hypothetical protein